MSKENAIAKGEAQPTSRATDATAKPGAAQVDNKALQAESTHHLSSRPGKEYTQAFKVPEKSASTDLTIQDNSSPAAKPIKKGSLDSNHAPESLAKAGLIVDKTNKSNDKVESTPVNPKVTTEQSAESKPENNTNSKNPSDQIATTKEASERTNAPEKATPKTIAVELENKDATASDSSKTTKPNFTVRADGQVEMYGDPEKQTNKEVKIVLERQAGQLDPTKEQIEAANELVSYLSRRMTTGKDGKPAEGVILKDKIDIVSRVIEQANNLRPPKEQENLSPQTREQIGKLNRFNGSGGVDMPMSSSEGTGSFDTRQVPRQLNETDKQAAMKEVLAGLFQPDEKAPYETISKTSDGITHVGRYGLSAEQLADFLKELGEPPDPTKIDELIRAGKLPKDYGEKLKDPKFFNQLKELVTDIQSGKVTAEALGQLLPKEVQETIAGDLVEKMKGKVGDQPGAIAAAVLSGKSSESLTQQDIASPAAQEAAGAGQKLYEIATHRVAQESAQRNPGSSEANMGNVPEGERRELIAKALQLAGQPVTDSALAAVNTIVEKESSWNPKARNDWDINAKNGIPSQGLMQTIPPTFKENAIPGYDKDITDPLSNLIAGIRYSTKRYGSVEEVVRRTKSGGKNQGY
jgi:hypothetical protein